MNAPSDETSRGWSPMVIGGVIGGVLLLLLLIPTFRRSDPQTDSAPGGTATGEEVSQSQCERTLQSIVDGLQPNRLGISSEARVMVDTLNNWAAQCVDVSKPIVNPDDPQLRENLLTAAGLDHSQSERFQPRDAEQIRNSLLAAAIVDRITADLRSDQERALALFYYVVRTLELLPEEAPELLLTPFESLVSGLATADDRGWTYALLMRQLRLDVVKIQPRGGEKTDYWLLGAIIPGEGVLLLDPQMGLPISPASDVENPQSPLPSTAATLAEVRQNDQWLRHYDQPDRAYPLTAADLQTVDVYAIGTSSTFAPRLGRLQAALPEIGEIFDGLGSSELREVGLIERLVRAGGDELWTRDQVHVWPYPEQLWSNVDEYTDEQQQRLAAMQAVLSGPLSIAITVSISEQDELQLATAVEKPQRSLREARIEQLLGNFADAQQTYLRARLNQVNLGELRTYFKSVQETITEQIDNPQEAQQTFLAIQQQVLQQVGTLIQNVPQRQLNILSADMATYWAAQAQYEQQEYRLAAESAGAYLNRGGGNFLMSAIYLASLSLAKDGRPDEAVELAEQRSAQASASLGYLALVDRWRKHSSASDHRDTPEPEKDEERSPADKMDDAPAGASAPDDAPAKSDTSGASDKPQASDANDETRPPPPPLPEAVAPAEADDGATSGTSGAAENSALDQDSDSATDPSDSATDPAE